MSPGFSPPDVITDPLVLAANAKTFLEEELPGWTSADGSIEDLVVDANSYTAAEQAESLEAELIAAFRSLGPLVGVTPIQAQPATGVATFTVIDTAGYTITAAGTVIGITDVNGDLQTFRPIADVVIAPGASTGTGTVEATEPGEAANGLSGEADVVAGEGFLTKASLGTTGGGLDEETEEAFLDRLTEELRIVKPGPVLADDAALLARNVPGVYRATAVNLLKPSAADGGEGAEEANAEKCVTVVCVDETGAPCSAEVRAAVDAALQAVREVNMKFFVVKPHYTKIDVATTVFAWPGYDTAIVKAEVDAAIRAYLSAAKWAPDVGGRAQTWRDDHTVRLSGLMSAVLGVRGVRWCSTLTFAKHGEALATTNVTLGSGSAVPALPDTEGIVDGTGTPSTITTTVEPST